jgi:hypothetical protein
MASADSIEAWQDLQVLDSGYVACQDQVRLQIVVVVDSHLLEVLVDMNHQGKQAAEVAGLVGQEAVVAYDVDHLVGLVEVEEQDQDRLVHLDLP